MPDHGAEEGGRINQGGNWQLPLGAGGGSYCTGRYFVPGYADDIHAFFTLEEVANLDEDEDGITGEGAIGGHNVEWFVSAVTVEYWQYDYITETYIVAPQTVAYTSGIDLGAVNFDVGPTAFGKKINDLVTLGTASESPSGQYTSPQTVNDYVNDVYDIETVIFVIDYTFTCKDLSVFVAPSTP